MRLPRSTGAMSGSLVVLLGLWGALIAFVGPYFNYSFGSNGAWHYTTDRLVLDILPGALAVAAGGVLLSARTRRAGVFGAWLGVLAGAWLVVGPAMSLTWEHAAGPIGRPLGGSTRQMLELVGYFYGLGALIIALVAFAAGRFASRPAILDQPAPVAPVVAATPVAAAPGQVNPTPSAPAYAPRTRRFALRRRPGGGVSSARGGRSGEIPATRNDGGDAATD